MARSTGIVKIHSRKCPSRSGGTCAAPCRPGYEAWVWSARDKKKIRRTFATESEARAWRNDAAGEVRRGRRRAPNGLTVNQAADSLIKGMKDGSVLNRAGKRFKPSVVRGYESDLDHYIKPELGGAKLTSIQRDDVKRIVDRMAAEDLSPSKIRNALMPLRVIFREALEAGTVGANALEHLRLPAMRRREKRIAQPDEAARLIAALPQRDRALWSTAFYAGLRRGELRALRWEDVDLAAGVIHIRRSWDDVEGEIAPKSEAGTRTVPIIAKLRDSLIEHKARTGDQGLVFGTSPENPFTPSNVRKRANTAWANAKPKPLEAIELHQARHTFASLLIDAEVNPKAIQRYLGHSSIQVTFDVYGGLFEAHEAKAAAKVDDYLALADTAARIAQLAE